MHYLGLPEFPDFQIPGSRKYGNSLEIAVFDKLQHIRYFSHSVLVTEFGFSLRIFESSLSWNFQIPDSRKSGIWKFLENENSKIPSEKSNSVTKTEWEKYPISCNLSNAAISREFPDFLESGIWKSGNSGIHQKCPKLTYK